MFDADDNYLIEKAVSGDAKSFEVLDFKYRPKVRNFIYHRVCNREDAEDIMQITFLNAYTAIKNFRQESSFLTWLCSIALNNIRRFIYENNKFKSSEAINEDEIDAINYKIGNCIYNDPENIYIANQTEKEIIRTVMMLPESLRTVFFLREIECLSYQEISAQMGCPIGTVRSRIYRARAEFLDRSISNI